LTIECKKKPQKATQGNKITHVGKEEEEKKLKGDKRNIDIKTK